MWKRLGLILASIGGYALRGAVAASTHPEVVSAVAAAVGHPEVGAVLNTANAVVAAVEKK